MLRTRDGAQLNFRHMLHWTFLLRHITLRLFQDRALASPNRIYLVNFFLSFLDVSPSISPFRLYCFARVWHTQRHKRSKAKFSFIEIPSPYLAFSGSSRLHLKTKIKLIKEKKKTFSLRVYRKLSETSAKNKERKRDFRFPRRNKEGKRLCSGGTIDGFFCRVFSLRFCIVSETNRRENKAGILKFNCNFISNSKANKINSHLQQFHLRKSFQTLMNRVNFTAFISQHKNLYPQFSNFPHRKLSTSRKFLQGSFFINDDNNKRSKQC